MRRRFLQEMTLAITSYFFIEYPSSLIRFLEPIQFILLVSSTVKTDS